MEGHNGFGTLVYRFTRCNGGGGEGSNIVATIFVSQKSNLA